MRDLRIQISFVLFFLVVVSTIIPVMAQSVTGDLIGSRA